MLTSDPLPASPPQIAVDSEKALAIAMRDQNFGSAMQPGTPTVTLRMVRIGLPEDEPTPRLAWVLTWRNSKLDLHGPIGLSAEKRAEIVANASCVFLVVIDATTGSTEYVAQLCG
jgi:hypothetical protein